MCDRMVNMKTLPRLSNSEVQTLAISLEVDSTFPIYFILNALFNTGSGYSSFNTFSDRLNSYVQSEKELKDNDRTALIELTIKVLKHFQLEGLLNDADYDSEYDRCQSILFPNTK